MANLKDIRKRIGSVKNTQQITKAMKMVAASRLRKAQAGIQAMRPYSYRLRDVIGQLAARADFSDHPLLEQRSPDTVELLIFTSDRGLCGGFNSNVNRTTERYVRENKDGHHSMALDIIGRKGHEYFRRRDTVSTNEYFADVLTNVSLTRSGEIAEHAITSFIEKKLDAVYCVYNEFKSAITQEVVVEQLLPVVPAVNDEDSNSEFIYEPSKQDIMDAVLPRHLTVQIYRMTLESVASEMGARMSAMDAATKNAGELIDRLTLQYNRARQAAITTELMEIIGGAEALKG